jgi:hypothetical protein
MALRQRQGEFRGGPYLRRVAGCLALVVAAVLAAGCQSVEHGYTTADYAERPLAISSEEGARRLAMESDVDASVREFVVRFGQPDFLYVVDRRSVYLFYATRDLVGVFLREFVARSEVQTFRPIPGYLLKLLPAGDRERLLAARSRKRAARPAASGRAARSTLARAEARSRAHPAAPRSSAGGDGWTDRGFDIDAIVQRLRTPMTAADVGVSGWQRSTGAGGVPQRMARSGNTRFEVRSDTVMVTTPIPAGRGATPGQARLAFLRVNRAVFGTQAGDVNQRVAGLAARVSNDPSGGTRIAQRMAGRTVRIHRIPARGWFVYSVHP